MDLSMDHPHRIVLLIDLHPLLPSSSSSSSSTSPYLTAILAAARRILSSTAPTTLVAFRLFFSSLSPILSASRLHSPSSLSFDHPLPTLLSLSHSLSSLTTSSPNPSSAPLASLLAQSLLQLEHDYAWEDLDTHTPTGNTNPSFPARSNLVLLFSPISQLDPDTPFVRDFGPVRERFVARDIHLSWVDVNFSGEELPGGLGDVAREVRELGWGFCSTDAIVLGSALVPFGLIFPYIGCSLGFVGGSGGERNGRAELVMEIADVNGEPLECKCCELEVLEVKPMREMSASCSLFSCGSLAKIQIKEVYRGDCGAELTDNSCCLVLLRGMPECTKGNAGHFTKGSFADRVLELLCMGNSEFIEGKPVWQLFLAFLYKRGYCVLVSVSDTEGNSLEGILKPFTINYALLSILRKDYMGSRQFINRASTGSSDMLHKSVSDVVPCKDGGKKRNKFKDVTWSSFCEAAFSQVDDIAPGMDLEDVYFSRECSKSKKIRFLKCWMRQIEKSTSCCQVEPEEPNKPSDTKEDEEEEDEKVLDSQQDPEGQLSSSSGGTHLGGPMSEDASSFDCVDDPEAFFSSIPQKIETGLGSEEADLGNLAERLVSLSICALHAKFRRNAVEWSDSAPNEGEAACDMNIVAEVSRLLLKNPKDLSSKYRGFNSSSLASDPSSTIQNTNGKIREHELQILFRMEMLRSKIEARIELNTRHKMIKEICSLLRSIEFDLEGESFHGESLLEFAERTVKSRYARFLGDVIHKIYNQMEFYSFDRDEIEASDPLLNSNSDELKRDADDNAKNAGDVTGSTIGVFRSQNTICPRENVANRQQEADNVHEKQLLKAQEQRNKAQRFSSFTSWMPDLQRVWALKPSKSERSSNKSLPKMSRRRKRRTTADDMVCETPMTGKKLSSIQQDEGNAGNSRNKSHSSKSLSKALFSDE